MPPVVPLLAIVSVIALAGCGGESGRGAGQPGDDSGPGPTARGEHESTGQEEAYQAAVEAFEDDDFDTAIPAMESLSGYRDADEQAQRFREAAAEKMIRNARRKLRSAPQAAVAQLRTSLKYHPTPEARRLLTRARRLLKAFQRKEEAKRRAAAQAEG